MHRRNGPSAFLTPEEEPFLDNTPTEQQKEPWDMFLNTPRKVVSGSMADSKFFDTAEKVVKLIVFVLTFVIVLGCAAISKGTLLFMTSQIVPDVKSYCNKCLGRYKQFEVTLPDVERAAWIWVIFFAYCVPQVGIFIRSLRICVFKTWQAPGPWEFISLFVTESLPAIGSAIMVFTVLPELDVVKGAMLTNAVCFIPGIIGFLSWKPGCSWTSIKVVLDVMSATAQATSFVVWPLVENKPVLWLIPVSVILISCGWWENYVCENSSVKFISELAKTKKNFSNGKYFMYTFVSLWKCLVFFMTMVLIFTIREGDVKFIDNFANAFSSHGIFITEVAPIIASAGTENIDDVMATGAGTTLLSSYLTPIWVFLINIAATYVCYITGKFACKVMIQGFSFAFPINLTMPVTLSGLIAISGVYVKDSCAFSDSIPPYLFFDVPPMYFLKDFIGHEHAWIWLIWLLSQAWITAHIWSPTCERMAHTEKLFVRPMYDPFFIDQDIALNRRRNDDEEAETTDNAFENSNNTYSSKDNTTRIFACGTMWHETKDEMEEFLKSVVRLDSDQSARRLARNKMHCEVPDYYELETHIFFDDAFYRTKKHPEPRINSYVKDLISTVVKAVHNVHETERIIIMPPTKYTTPYGGQLVWILPGRTKMIAHLKDKAKIRAKKRWSQVMYMYYLLGYKLLRQNLTDSRKDVIAENTYILALDGDIDFQPKAVHLLVDLMRKNKSLGAACGRIHPIGSGPMVWYQKFEYAIGHWLQKATEHMIGCVLCSPGCFSLFRGKALIDDSVMAKYTTRSVEARDYVQYDQGEDRWLCTLLLQRGFRVEYSAASDAYTHCPEGFNEFYNQRRRWIPSTTANILDLLMDYKHTVKINDNISRLYIMYQMVMMVGTVLGPGSIFLMLVGAFVAAFQMDQYSSFMWNASPVLIFIMACKLFKNEKVQLFFAATISAIYGLIMMAVLVGIMLQIHNDGFLAPSSLFFFCVAGEMILTAMLHPKEFGCLMHGIVYYVTVPSMYMLLIIYSVFNMNNVSWGTRDITIIDDEDKDETTDATPKEPAKNDTMKNKVLNFFGKSGETGSFDLSVGNLFRCLLCTSETNPVERYQLEEIKTTLSDITQRLDNLSRGVQEPEVVPEQPRRKTIMIEGARAQAVLNENDLISETSDVPSTTYATDWMDDEVLLKGETDNIDMHEEDFWKGIITKYLHPIDDEKDNPRLQQNLIDLRDKAVAAFFMINALFVLVVFLLTLKKEMLHINWPFGIKANFTYKEDIGQIYLTRQYLELEPIGMVFLIFFAILLVVQFIAMLLHRFATLCQILANTVLDWGICKNNSEKVSEDAILRGNAVEIAKQLQKLKDDEDEIKEERVGRRKTVARMMQANSTARPVVRFLDEAYERRQRQFEMNPKQYKGPVRRDTMFALQRRVTVVQQRMSMAAPAPPPGIIPNGGNENFAFQFDSE